MKVEHIICYLIELRQLEKKLAEIKIQWDMDGDNRLMRHYRPLAAKFDPEHEKKIQDEYDNHQKNVDKLENRIKHIDDLLYNFMQTNEANDNFLICGSCGQAHGLGEACKPKTEKGSDGNG